MWKFIRGLFGPQPPITPVGETRLSAKVAQGETQRAGQGGLNFSTQGIVDTSHDPRPGNDDELLGLIEERGFLTSADIDPEGSQRTADYFEAERLTKSGNIKAALEILERLCSQPNIYKGHYRLLFQLHRQANKEDLKAGDHEIVRARVLNMIRLDDEMIGIMLAYWSEMQRRKLGPHYFDADRNLKVTDANALFAAAEALKDRKSASQAKKLIERFERIRDKAKTAKGKT